MLLREVEVGFRDLLGKHQSIMFVASGLSQLLELFRPEHFSQSVGRIHGAVDHVRAREADLSRAALSMNCSQTQSTLARSAIRRFATQGNTNPS